MSETATWQPSASIPNLLKRAAIMTEIRRFFADRGVLEVETPCMSQATVTDIHLVPFETRFVGPGHSQGMNLYLMTSPEYHMKRLLAAGVVRCISCAAVSEMKRWVVTITRNSPCWSGTARIMICTA